MQAGASRGGSFVPFTPCSGGSTESHCLIATPHVLRARRYWEFAYTPAAELAAGPRDERWYVEEFAAVFEEAVRPRMRGDTPASMPFYNQKKVIALLDKIPAMPDADRVGWDPVLTSILSACVLQETFKLGAGRTYDRSARRKGLGRLYDLTENDGWDGSPRLSCQMLD
jgi:hypothetical protein